MAESRRGESTEESKDDDAGKINGLQIAAASGAASTGALVAHALGIYGTVAGVALFSVVSSVGTVLYLKSIHRTRDKLRKVVKQVNTTKFEKTSPGPNDDAVVTEVVTRQEHVAEDTTVLITRQQRDDPDATEPIARQGGGGTNMLPVAEDEESASFPHRLRAWWKRYWKPVTATSVAAFVLSLTILTGIAWVSGQPPTQYYNGNNDDGAPAPQPTQPADEDTFDDDPPPSQPEEPDDTAPSSEPSQPEPSPEGGEDSQEQPQEPSTQPDDPDTTEDTPEETPEDEDDPQQESVPSHDSAVTW